MPMTKKSEKLLRRQCMDSCSQPCSFEGFFCLKLVENLKEYWFKIHQYDSSIANIEIGGSQMIVTFLVDDLKVSHVKLIEISKFFLFISKIW